MTQIPAITQDYIDARRAQLKAELADLEASERVLKKANGHAVLLSPPVPTPGAHTGGRQKRLPFTPGQPSKKRTLLEVISKAPKGLSTQQIIQAGSDAGLADLRNENTSPQLSGCKSKGLLTLLDGVWRITDAGREFLEESKT